MVAGGGARAADGGVQLSVCSGYEKIKSFSGEKDDNDNETMTRSVKVLQRMSEIWSYGHDRGVITP